MNATWGVLQEYFLANHTFPNINSQQLTWIGSIGCASVYVAAPMVVLLNSVLGTKLVLSFGLILGSIGFIGGSFATQAWHLYFSLVNHSSRDYATKIDDDPTNIPFDTPPVINFLPFKRARSPKKKRVCLIHNLLVFLTFYSPPPPSTRPFPLD